LRGASERLERGIARYGEGDLAGALVEFEEALKLYPASARGQQFVAWVRDVQAGQRSSDGKKGRGLDEDAVRAINQALDDEPPTAVEPTRTAHQPGAADAPRGGESPWDPVPLAPGGPDAPAQARSRGVEARAPLKPPGSSSTVLGMPPLEPRLLAPPTKKRTKVTEDRPESVTREFRSTTPTGPNLRPLDVPELTDEQIHNLLSLDSPLLPEGRTTPEIELERIDDSSAERLIELEAVPAPLPQPVPPALRKNDTSPMGVESYHAEFDSHPLTPTGVKSQGLKPVRVPQPEDDPYADLNLLPLDVAPDLGGSDEAEDGGTNPTNPFDRGAKLAQYTSFGSSSEIKLEDMPPLPSLPFAGRGSAAPPPEPATGSPRAPADHPLGAAEAALQAGDLGAAVDACEAALTQAGGLASDVVRAQLPLVERIYSAVLGGFDRVPVHGQATGDLEPRSAFLLSRLDSAMTVEDVLDVSGMPRLEALRVLALLVRRGAVVFK